MLGEAGAGGDLNVLAQVFGIIFKIIKISRNPSSFGATQMRVKTHASVPVARPLGDAASTSGQGCPAQAG